jgi:hypothetical protein
MWGELHSDQLCDRVGSNPDETEVVGQVAYDCQTNPTSSDGMEYFGKLTHFSEATQMSQSTQLRTCGI